MYIIFMDFAKFIYHILSLYIYVCGCNFILYIVVCQGENENILILDIDGKNTMYVFASKGGPGICGTHELSESSFIFVDEMNHFRHYLT